MFRFNKMLQAYIFVFQLLIVSCSVFLVVILKVVLSDWSLFAIENALELNCLLFIWYIALYFLSFRSIPLYFDNHFVNWSTRSSKFLGQLKIDSIPDIKVDVFCVLNLFEFFNGFQIIGLYCIMNSMHLIGPTQLIKIK